jgi:hypothetical protein
MASGDKVSLNRHICRDSSRSKMTSILLYSAGAQHIGMSDAVGLPTRLTRPLLAELRLSAIDPSETFANGHRAPSPLASTPRSGDEVRLLTYVRPTAHVIVARRLWSPKPLERLALSFAVSAAADRKQAVAAACDEHALTK